MPQGLFEKIINESSGLGLKNIGIAGFGEPLCDPNILKKVEYAKRTNGTLNIQMTSTLFLLNEKHIECFLENLDTIHVSFYGMSSNTYEKIHGGGLKFEVSKENILRLIEKKKLAKSKKPSIVMRYLLDEINENEMSKFVTFWEPLVDEVMVWKPHNYLYGRRYREINIRTKESCDRPFTNMWYFDIEGRVTMCCFDFNKDLEVGNVKYQTIKEILLGEKLKNLRDSHWQGKYDGLICKSCDQRLKRPDVLVYSTDKSRNIREHNMSRKKYLDLQK